MSTTPSELPGFGGGTASDLNDEEREKAVAAYLSEVGGGWGAYLILSLCGVFYAGIVAADWALNADSFALYLRNLPTSAIHVLSGVFATLYAVAGFLALVQPARRGRWLAGAAALVLAASSGVGVMRYLGENGDTLEEKVLGDLFSEWIPLVLPPLLAMFTFVVGVMLHRPVTNALLTLRLARAGRKTRRAVAEYGRQHGEYERRRSHVEDLDALHRHLKAETDQVRTAVRGRLARVRFHARYLMAHGPDDPPYLKDENRSGAAR